MLSHPHRSHPFRLSRGLQILLGLVILLQLIAPFFAKTDGVDASHLIWWNSRFWLMLKSGILFPHWINDSFGGLGAPALYFYPPMMFYESAIVQMLTGISDASQLFQLTGLLATIGSYFSAKLLLDHISASRWQAMVGAALFAFAPFRIAELYNRSGSAHFGYAFFPLVWYAILLLHESDSNSRQKGIILLAVSCALICLSNIPLTVLTVVTMVLGGLAQWEKLRWRLIRDVIFGGVLSILLVAFFLIPIFQYRSYSHLEQVWLVNGQSRDPGYFIDLFLHGRDLGALYHIGLIYIGIGAVGFLTVRWLSDMKSLSPQESRGIRVAAMICSAIVFLQIPVVSLPIWEHVPGFDLIQGGWRFYIDVVILVSILVAVARHTFMQRAMTFVATIWALGSIYPIFLVMLHIHPSKHFDGRPNFDAPEYASVFTKFVVSATLEDLVDRHASEPELLPWGNITPSESFLAHPRLATSQTLDLNFTQPHRVTFHRSYWPAWHLYVPDSQLKVWPDSIGRMVADLPSGKYTAEWRLQKSWQERAGYWISGLTLLGMMLCSGIGRYRRGVKGTR